jgi:hypothetical protein
LIKFLGNTLTAKTVKKIPYDRSKEKLEYMRKTFTENVLPNSVAIKNNEK